MRKLMFAAALAVAWYGAYQKAEIAKWWPIIRSANIKGEQSPSYRSARTPAEPEQRSPSP
jgi:hypothetical protein